MADSYKKKNEVVPLAAIKITEKPSNYFQDTLSFQEFKVFFKARHSKLN